VGAVYRSIIAAPFTESLNHSRFSAPTPGAAVRQARRRT
jgi:hypothetical protein